MGTTQSAGSPGRHATDLDTTFSGGEPTRDRKLRAQGKKTLQRLLDAGMMAFDRKGYHAATVDDVVKAAKTSRGTFYLYFSNMDDLLKALALNVAEEGQALVEGLEHITPDEAGYAALHDWLDRFSALYSHYGPVIRAWQEAEASIEFADLGINVLTEFTEILVARISDGFQGTDVNPHIAALAFVSMLERFNFLLASRRVTVKRDEMLDTLTAIIHGGFFSGPSRPPPSSEH